jgi:CTP synthase
MSENKGEPIRILLVEDEEGPAEAIKRTLEENLGQAHIQVEQNFEQALLSLKPHSFEAVVLDLFLGDPAQNEKEGRKVWEQIWKTKLVPIIVHTAGECELEPNVPIDNPFLKCITKHTGSDVEVAKHLQSLIPHILALRQVEQEFNKAIHSVIEDVSPLIWRAEANDRLRRELLLCSARRRLAAKMDQKTLSTGESMLSWEQYIYPPMEDSLLTGDVLRIKDGKFEDPMAYRLVLTPSCDLVMRNGKCKVEKVLVAKCKSRDEYLKVVAVQANIKPKDLDKKILKSRITEPQLGGYILLPEYKSVLPSLAVHLRNLEMIPITEISLTDNVEANFKRITSIDSPFREQITWAYLQIAGRPGVPDRDIDKWTKEILEASPSTATT